MAHDVNMGRSSVSFVDCFSALCTLRRNGMIEEQIILNNYTNPDRYTEFRKIDDSEQKKSETITLREFLMTKTEQGDICVIFEYGYPVGMVYVDREDIMTTALPVTMLDKTVIDFDKGKFRTVKGQVIDVLNIEVQGKTE